MYGTKQVDLGAKGSFNVKKGALHRHLGIPEGEKIGPERIERALSSPNPEIRKEARSAKGFAAMNHSK